MLQRLGCIIFLDFADFGPCGSFCGGDALCYRHEDRCVTVLTWISNARILYTILLQTSEIKNKTGRKLKSVNWHFIRYSSSQSLDRWRWVMIKIVTQTGIWIDQIGGTILKIHNYISFLYFIVDNLLHPIFFKLLLCVRVHKIQTFVFSISSGIQK